MKLITELFDVGIDLVCQHMAALTHILMATPGPQEGTTCCCNMSDDQVLLALDNLQIGAERAALVTRIAMTTHSTPQGARWLYMPLIELKLAEQGASTIPEDDHNTGVRSGHVHMGDSGML